jgi:hypothetical protein
MRAHGKGGKRTTRKVTIKYRELSDHEKEYFQVPRPVFEITQKMAGCWVAGWPRPKISLGAGGLGGPGSKFAWVLGDWVAQTENFAGCWGAGWPRPKISLGAGRLGGPGQKFCWVLGDWVHPPCTQVHPGHPIGWIFRKIRYFTTQISHFDTYLGGWVHPAQKICWVLGGWVAQT